MARSGSKGIINKNLKKINNISLVGNVAKFLKKIKFIDLSIVSTDSKKIGLEASKYGLNFLFLRPKKISGPKISDEVVLNHSLLSVEKIIQTKFDIIISLPPTSPLRKKAEIIESIKKQVKGDYDAVWTVSKTDSKYHPYKALILNHDKLNFFSRKGKKIKYRQQLNEVYHRNGSCYVFSRKSILNKKILTKNSSYIVCKKEHISIDTLDDLNKVRKILEK